MPKGDNTRKLTNEQRSDVIRRYVTPADDGSWTGTKIIARDFGVTPPAIDYILTKAGIEKRDARESHAHGKRCKPIKNIPVGEAPLCKCGCGQPTCWNRRVNCWNIYVVGHYRRAAAYKDESWLRAEYEVNRRTLADIAKGCGVNKGSIMKFMKRFGIDRRSTSEAITGKFVGSLNPCWRGGTTPERQRLYKAGGWQEFVQTIYARDGFACRRCGAPKKGYRGLHAHHVTRWSDDESLRFEPSNVVTLCRKCHEWIHSQQNTEGEYLT